MCLQVPTRSYARKFISYDAFLLAIRTKEDCASRIKLVHAEKGQFTNEGTHYEDYIGYGCSYESLMQK